jgi:hypothetical protein
VHHFYEKPASILLLADSNIALGLTDNRAYLKPSGVDMVGKLNLQHQHALYFRVVGGFNLRNWINQDRSWLLQKSRKLNETINN